MGTFSDWNIFEAESSLTMTKIMKPAVIEDMLAYQDSVFRICLGFSRNISDAEDLAQDVFLKAYRKLGTLKNPSLSKEWLFRVAKNTCLDYQKKSRLGRLLLLQWREASREMNNPEAEVAQNEQIQRLKKAVQRLPKRLRVVFVMREYGHLSYQEIAATLGIKEGTVMSRLNRARSRVTEALQEATHETR